MGVVGLYLRRKTEEGPEFAALQRHRESIQAKVTPIAEAFRAHWRRILLFTAFMGSWATFATLLTNYPPSSRRTATCQRRPPTPPTYLPASWSSR
jgi:MHS family proline/betaine transporter-like MFS transporter